MQKSRGGRVVEESGGRRDIEKRSRMPERSGIPSRGRSCCRCRTTMAQKLDEDLLAAFNSSFQ